MDGEAHDVEIRAVNGGASYITYPLLNAIGTCFVKGFIAVYIITDFFVGQVFEGDVRFIDKGNNPTRPPLKGGDFLRESDGGIDLVGFAGEGTEHGKGFGLVMGFAEHFSIRPDDGVGGNEELGIVQAGLVRARFRTRDKIRYIAGLEIRGECLIGINGDRCEGDIQAREQLAAAGRGTTK